MPPLHIPGIENRSEPGGVYERAIAQAKANGSEYPKIWDLLAFGRDHASSLVQFTQSVLRAPAAVSPGLRELVAAYTSRLNRCEFCMKAHAAAASVLLQDEALVDMALADLESAPLPEKEKTILRFVEKVTLRSADITADDMKPMREQGWDDEAIYYVITTCALFNFYNRWISASGVPAMPDELHKQQGEHLAKGYIRE